MISLNSKHYNGKVKSYTKTENEKWQSFGIQRLHTSNHYPNISIFITSDKDLERGSHGLPPWQSVWCVSSSIIWALDDQSIILQSLHTLGLEIMTWWNQLRAATWKELCFFGYWHTLTSYTASRNTLIWP